MRKRPYLAGWLLALGLLALPAQADPARQAQEINWTASAATAVVAGLQGKINGGTILAADLAADSVRPAFQAAYQRLAGQAFDAPAEPPVATIRRVMAESMDATLAQFRADILRGGQDAFVPAFFRAQLLERFNAAAGGGFRALVSNRGSELINADWAIDRQIQEAEVQRYVGGLMEAGATAPTSRQIGDQLVAYWPMSIGEACQSCHARNGLQQQLGQFGGATVVIVGR